MGTPPPQDGLSLHAAAPMTRERKTHTTDTPPRLKAPRVLRRRTAYPLTLTPEGRILAYLVCPWPKASIFRAALWSLYRLVPQYMHECHRADKPFQTTSVHGGPPVARNIDGWCRHAARLRLASQHVQL